MPTTPYAKALISDNGGAATSGWKGDIAAGHTVTLSAESISGWGSAKWELVNYPSGIATPAGWSLDGTTGIIYFIGNSPPDIVDDGVHWGRWLGRLTVDNGAKGGIANNPDMLDFTWGWDVVSPVLGMREPAFLEGTQYSAKRWWVKVLQEALHAMETVLGPLAGSGSQISVKSYGAKGDGTTDDSAAFQAAVTALAGTGVALYVPAGTYLANFTIDKADMVIVGQGATSIIKSATNAPAISIRADQGATRTILRDFKVLGTGAGASQVGIANGVSATLASGDGRALIDRIIVEGTGSDGIQIFNQDTTNVGLHIGTRILAPRIESCGAGASGYAINVGALAEYVMVDTPSLYSNQRGIGIFAGNFCGGGPGTIVTTTEYAIEIGPASNDAHGIIAGWNINHNGHALYAYGITLGFDFVGCHFYDNTDIILGDSGGGGCVGVRFIGGAIDVSNIYFRGSTGTRFLGVAWPGSNANTMYPNLTYPSTQYFDPSNLDLAGNAPAFIAAGVVGWTPAPGKSAVSFASDANHTASAAEYTRTFLQVTSGVSLTGTRDLVLPISAGAQWTVYNGTTGAQSIQVIGATGTGITIANGKRAILESDGTNMQRVTADT